MKKRSRIYGRDFAPVYVEKWSFWSEKIWPFIIERVDREIPQALYWLDLCCGTGPLLRFICARGFDATGLDNSPHQLREARRLVPYARYVQDDVRSFSLGRTYQVITCLFDSLNYLTRKRCLEKAFRRAGAHLADGGLFIFDMNTYEGLLRSWCRTSVIKEPDYTTIVESSFSPARALGQVAITGFIKEGRRFRKFEEIHIERGYRPEEIDGALAKAGLTFRKHDGITLGRAGKRSKRLVYICRKR